METENNEEMQPQKRTLTSKIGMFAIIGLCIVTVSLFFTFKHWWSGLIWTVIFVLLVALLNGKFEKSFKKELALVMSFSVAFILSIFVLTYSIKSRVGIYTPPYSGSSGSYNYSTVEKCLNCNNPISGKGFSTIGGEEYACTENQCYYCSRSCARASRPKGW
jgi:hypothetical protein